MSRPTGSSLSLGRAPPEDVVLGMEGEDEHGAGGGGDWGAVKGAGGGLSSDCPNLRGDARDGEEEGGSFPATPGVVDEFLPVPRCCGKVGKQVVVCAPFGVHERTFPCLSFVGPDWPCLMYTYAMIVVPTTLFMIFVASKFHFAVWIAGGITFVWAAGGLSCAACSDPGVIKARSGGKRAKTRVVVV